MGDSPCDFAPGCNPLDFNLLARIIDHDHDTVTIRVFIHEPRGIGKQGEIDTHFTQIDLTAEVGEFHAFLDRFPKSFDQARLQNRINSLTDTILIETQESFGCGVDRSNHIIGVHGKNARRDIS